MGCKKKLLRVTGYKHRTAAIASRKSHAKLHSRIAPASGYLGDQEDSDAVP